MPCNSSPCSGTQLQDTSQGPYISTNSLFSGSMSSNCSLHKSFDFSNINIGSSQYKQFHQTRIYVKDFQGMTTGGSQVGGKGSTYIISSNLPESFNYAIGSEWGNPLSDIFKGVGNLVMQFASSAAMQAGGTIGKIGSQFRSGINRAANFLIWNGAKPLEIQLKIPVIDDNSYQSGCGNVKTNLKEALEFLGCLALPNLDGSLGFYTPAPSPLQLTVKYNGNNYTLSPNKARIMVQIGGILFIDNCIIKGVSVSYPNTKALMRKDDGSLSPVLAEVTITITTIETLTSRTYTKMLWLKQQPDQGNFKLDVDQILEQGKKVGNALWEGGKNLVNDGINTIGGHYFGGNSGPGAENAQSNSTFQIPLLHK